MPLAYVRKKEGFQFKITKKNGIIKERRQKILSCGFFAAFMEWMLNAFRSNSRKAVVGHRCTVLRRCLL